MAARVFRIVCPVGLLEELEHPHIDGTIREHADQAHCNATIGCSHATISVHLPRRLANKGTAGQTALNGLALKAELERVHRVHTESIVISKGQKSYMSCRSSSLTVQSCQPSLRL